MGSGKYKEKKTVYFLCLAKNGSNWNKFLVNIPKKEIDPSDLTMCYTVMSVPCSITEL